MSKKLSLSINGKRYDVEADGEFVAFLEQTLDEDFNIKGNNDIKLLLHSYIKKTYELFLLEQNIAHINDKLELDNT